MKKLPNGREMVFAPIYLAQTDTTAGFLCKEAKRLNAVKNRKLDKPCILCVAKLKDIKARVPKKYKKLVRLAKKTTFIFPNGKSFRVVKDELHRDFLLQTGALFSTSANLSGKKFDINFAKQNADIIVQDERGFFEGKPSSLLKLGIKNLKKLR